jgi:selenide,water dikinase
VDELVALAYDPQTAGGLLVCLPAERAPTAVAELERRGVFVRRIGRVEDGSGVVLA